MALRLSGMRRRGLPWGRWKKLPFLRRGTEEFDFGRTQTILMRRSAYVVLFAHALPFSARGAALGQGLTRAPVRHLAWLTTRIAKRFIHRAQRPMQQCCGLKRAKRASEDGPECFETLFFSFFFFYINGRLAGGVARVPRRWRTDSPAADRRLNFTGAAFISWCPSSLSLNAAL